MNSSIQIIIDPGHGGAETGAVANGYKEKDVNLQISLALYNKVKAYFSNVFMIRDHDTYLGINERAARVNELAEIFYGKTICLSIHLNAFDGSARGTETIYSIHSDGKLAKLIADKITELGIPLRRTYSKQSETTPGLDYYCMHRETGKAQDIIVESLFLDNADDVCFLKQDGFISKLANKIYDGLIEYVEPVTVQPKPEVPHWAKAANDELLAAGLLENDHAAELDSPATKGFVIELVNRIRKEGK